MNSFRWRITFWLLALALRVAPSTPQGSRLATMLAVWARGEALDKPARIRRPVEPVKRGRRKAGK